jgi:hypothetical protein
VWIRNQNVSIGYESVSSCNLTVGGVSLGTISGTGTKTYLFTQTGNTTTVTCGTLSKTATVIDYTQKFA